MQRVALKEIPSLSLLLLCDGGVQVVYVFLLLSEFVEARSDDALLVKEDVVQLVEGTASHELVEGLGLVQFLVELLDLVQVV